MKTNLMTLLSAFSLGVLCCSVGNAQDDQAASVPSPLAVPGSNPFGNTYNRGGGLSRQIEAMKHELQEATTDDDKQKIKVTLEALVSKEYDERLAAYAEHLDQLEAKLLQMREQLVKRQDAKKEMVSLRMQFLEAEANGLGWPSDGRFQMGFGVDYQYSPYGGGPRGGVPIAVPGPSAIGGGFPASRPVSGVDASDRSGRSK